MRLSLVVLCTITTFGCAPGAFEGDGDEGLGFGTRTDEVIGAIESFNAALTADDRQRKYCKMIASPFVFYRGTNHLFWQDLATDSRLALFGDDNTRTWLQGDLHAYNYGAFDNDDGKVVYDLNDFDEVVIADYQLDLWRMATSMVLIADANGGFSNSEVADLLDSFTESYLDTAASYRGNDDENDAAITAQTSYGRLDEFLDDVEQSESRKQMLGDWTDKFDGVRAFDLTLEDLEAIPADAMTELRSAIDGYRQTVAPSLRDRDDYFAVKDIARRLNAGTGSLGTPRYYALIEGQTDDQDDDRILDVKRQGEPSAYPYLSAADRANMDRITTDQAQRTIIGYRALATDADDHLGWLALADGVYSVRERSPFKESFPTEILDSNNRFTNLAEQWGIVLATAHARADKDHDPAIIEYSFDKQVDQATDGRHADVRDLVREISLSYADQVDLDFRVFREFAAAMCE